jgi:Flp pilus assembly protein TadB
LPLGLGALVWLTTGWLGAGVLAACAFVVVPRLFTGQRDRKEWIARSEAIATWTEMLRDTMVAADGIEAAVAATVPVAPGPIRDQVALLDARRRSEQPLPGALARFAAELDHPSADLVVTALISAAEGEGSDFAVVLTRLAGITRSEVALRREIEASRAQVHTAARMMVGILIAAGLGFAVVSHGYFGPYAEPAGQVALVVVAALFTAGTLALERMSRIQTVERFTPRRLREPAE